MMQDVGKGKWDRRPVRLKAKKYKKKETTRKQLNVSLVLGTTWWTNRGRGVRGVISLVPFMGHAY